MTQLTIAEGDILYILDPTGKVVAHPKEKLAEKPNGIYNDEIMRSSSGEINFKVNGNPKRRFFLQMHKRIGELLLKLIDLR